MRKTMLLALALLMIMPTIAGCWRFLGGAAVGAGGATAVYESQKHEQMKRLEADFKAGNIDKEEYLRRKKEISEGSLIY